MNGSSKLTRLLWPLASVPALPLCISILTEETTSRQRRSLRATWHYSGCETTASAVTRAIVKPHRESQHLLFIVHGMHGAPSSFERAEEVMTEVLGSLHVSVHRCTANMPSEERTHDGIAAGGKRLAQEVRRVVGETQMAGARPLSVSFWGHSLGGLYVRYALAGLMDTGTDAGTIAGLRPCLFLTTACPHLGVAGTLPKPLLDFAAAVGASSRTCEELFLEDEDVLVLRLARDDKFLAPLKLFPFRALVANAWNDWIVDACTATLQPHQPLWLLDEEHAGDAPCVLHDTLSWHSFPCWQSTRAEALAVRPPYYSGHPAEQAITDALQELASLSWRLIFLSFDVYPPAASHICICEDRSWLEYLCREVLLGPLSNQQHSSC